MKTRESSGVLAFAIACIVGTGWAGSSAEDQDPFQVLEAVDASPSARHGACVLMSQGMVLVGAPADDTSLLRQGTVRVWVQGGAGFDWADPFILSVPDPEPDGGGTDGGDPDLHPAFGSSIARSGQFVAVGAPYLNGPDANDAGGVFLYQRLPNAFEYMQAIVPDRIVSSASFGSCIVFDDLDGLYIGAPGARDGLVERHVRSEDGQWLLDETFRLPDGLEGDGFGHALAWEAGDRSVVISAPGRDEIFICKVGDADSLPTPPMLTISAPPGAENFGGSLDAANGRIVVGAPAVGDDGREYVYEFDGGQWVLAQVIASPEDASQFGRSVAIDGDDLLVGSGGSWGGHNVHAHVFAAGEGFVPTIRLRGTSDGATASVDVGGGHALTGDLFAGGSGEAYLSLVRVDCDADGVADFEQIMADPALDCTEDGFLDSCQLLDGTLTDCNGNGVPDECENQDGSTSDCNGNGRFDDLDIASGESLDEDGDGIPDECEGRLDVVFVFDVTASKGETFYTLTEDLDSEDSKLLAIIEERSNGCARLGLVSFRDTVRVEHRLGEDIAVFREAVAGLELSGGGGTSEASDRALYEVLLQGEAVDCASGDPSPCCDADGDPTLCEHPPVCLANADRFDEPFRAGAGRIIIHVTDNYPGGCDDDHEASTDMVFARRAGELAGEIGARIIAVADDQNAIEAGQHYAFESGGMLMLPDEDCLIIDRIEHALRSLDLGPDLESRCTDCPEDVDQDGIIGVGDLLELISRYGSVEGDEGWDDRFDIDGDGAVGVTDVLAIIEAYGLSCDGRSGRRPDTEAWGMTGRPGAGG